MIDYINNVVATHDPVELLKGGGLVTIIAYVIWSDRSERRDNREADVKRSDAVKAMAEAVVKLAEAVLQLKKER